MRRTNIDYAWLPPHVDPRPSGTVNEKVLRLLTALLLVALSGCNDDRTASEPRAGRQRDTVEGRTLSDVTASTGLAGFKHVTGAVGEQWFPETVGGGVGVLDIDDDGWEDLALVGGGVWQDQQDVSPPAVWLFRNRGDGTFEDVTARYGLGVLHAYGQGLAVADFDNDGDDDIFLSTWGRNVLLRNDVNVFTDVTNLSGLDDEAEWSTSAIFFDADLDGHLDLYVGNYVEWTPDTDIWCTMNGETKSYCTPQLYTGTPGSYYRNNGDGTFTNRSASAGFATSPGKTLGVAEWDFDGNGYPDLVVANDTQRDLLYYNNGDGTFSEIGVPAGVAFDQDGKARAGMGVDVGVLDESGRATVVIGHFSNEMIGVYQQVGERLFVDRGMQSRVGKPSLATLTFGLVLYDADLDADLDIFVANGHIDEAAEHRQDGVSYRQYPQLFMNEGDGRFSDPGPPVALQLVARSAALTDFDRDGDEDVVVSENGAGVHLLRNEAAASSVVVRLEGTDANKDGIGADVIAAVGGRRIHRRVRTGSSFLASSSRTVTIGLGDASTVDTLTVTWPGGQRQVLTNVQANREIHVVQGVGITRERKFD